MDCTLVEPRKRFTGRATEHVIERARFDTGSVPSTARSPIDFVNAWGAHQAARLERSVGSSLRSP